jgi:pimeloyl-ACP methyl ester carboxylesterase
MTALVLLPGMDGTGMLFREFVAALGSSVDATVVRYPPDMALDYSTLKDIARAALPGHRPFVLLGESFSGPIAISLASTSPAGLIGLVLCCSFARNPLPVLGRLRLLVGLVPLKRVPVDLLCRLLLGRFSSPELRSTLNQALGRVSPAALRARLRGVLSIDVSDKLRQLRMPLLYLRATEDRLIPRAAGRLVSRLAPHARMVEVAAPHFLLQAVPSQAAAIVTEFVRELTECKTPTAESV